MGAQEWNVEVMNNDIKWLVRSFLHPHKVASGPNNGEAFIVCQFKGTRQNVRRDPSEI